jgi:hypothetical protein
MLAIAICIADGDAIRKAQAATPGSGIIAAPTAATVRAAPDSTFDCPDVTGRVFDDSNANGYPDPGERGIPDVRLATVRGLLVNTDAEGRFHIPCPQTPNANRGANFVMKLDARTLPTGYRMTTSNPRDIRLTRGKAGELDFGATLFHKVRVTMEDAAFEAGGVNLLPRWQQQIDILPDALLTRPSTITIVYNPGADAPELVRRRLAILRDELARRWKTLQGPYTLGIETE